MLHVPANSVWDPGLDIAQYSQPQQTKATCAFVVVPDLLHLFLFLFCPTDL